MASITFVDLPREIIYLVFNYLDHETLINIKDYIPPFKEYAYSCLNSNVLINRSSLNISLFFGYSTTQTSYENAQKIIKALESHPTVKFKKIRFDNPSDLIHLHERLPHVLQNAKIALSFIFDRSRGYLDKNVINKLIELPYTYDSIMSFPYDPYIFGMYWDQILRLTSLSSHLEIINSNNAALSQLGHAGTLRKLKLEEPIDMDELVLIPDCVTELNCTTFVRSDRAVCYLMFPRNLKSLRLDIIEEDRRNENILEIEISHLEKLELIEIKSPIKYLWRLPKNIKSIKTFGLLDFENLHVDYPRLVSFSDMYTSMNDLISDENKPIIFPEEVKNLELNYKYFAIPNSELELYENDMQIEKQPPKDRVILPNSLVNLKIWGSLFDDDDDSRIVTWGIGRSLLPNLSTLKLIDLDFPHEIGGQLPKFVTKISFDLVKNVEMSMFEGLSNLIDLKITSCSISESLVTRLPKNLQSLEIDLDLVDGPTDLTLTELPNIRTLSLCGGELIDHRDCGVSLPALNDKLSSDSETAVRFHFSSDFGWMESLQCLRFEIMNIDQLRHIPTNIKRLIMKDCNLEYIPEHFKFPDGLEYLALSGNELSSESLQSLPYKKIRYLDLSHNEITVLGRQGFSNFKNLETLHLEDNQLVGLNYDRLNPDTFGPHIKYLNLNHSSLNKSGIKNIREFVKSKPDLETIIVPKEFRGDDI